MKLIKKKRISEYMILMQKRIFKYTLSPTLG